MLYIIQVWPSSGVFHCTHSNVICHRGLTIIRSFSLYTQQCYMSYRFDHHQEFFTVHTAMLYVIEFWPSSGVFHCTHNNVICHTGLTNIRSFHCTHSNVICDTGFTIIRSFHCTHSNVICHTGLTIIRSFSLYTQQCYMWYRFDHHQEFFTLHTAMLYVIQVWP